MRSSTLDNSVLATRRAIWRSRGRSSRRHRQAFHDALSLDAETWARGRGWALWKALIIASGLVEATAIEEAHLRRTIEEVLADAHA